MADEKVSKYTWKADNIYLMSDLVRGKKRREPYRVHIHDKRINNKSHTYVKCFETLEVAKKDRDAYKRLLDLPKEHRQIGEMQATKVCDFCKEYRENISIKKGRDSEAGIIERFEKLPIAQKSIYDFQQSDADSYIAERLTQTYTRKGWKVSKPMSPAAVDREKTILRRIWSRAKKKYDKLSNPWIGRVEDYDPQWSGRNRTLEDGELERLLAACATRHGRNKTYAYLAILLALDTALRQDEIFNLSWKDINFKDRVIDTTRSKRDWKLKLPRNKIVVLALRPMLMLNVLWQVRFQDKPVSDMSLTYERIFLDWTKEAFRQCWWDLRAAAKIGYFNNERLQFKDLRRAAMDIFGEADLTGDEEKIMLGHSFRDIIEFYRSPRHRLRKLKRIVEKLDRHVLNGKTFEEVEKVELTFEGAVLKPKALDLIDVMLKSGEEVETTDEWRSPLE